jgi:hypothetical protein
MDLLEHAGSIQALQDNLPARLKRQVFDNIGGQLIPAADVQNLLKKINTNRISSWDEVHEWYRVQGDNYDFNKQLHALAALKEISGIDPKTADGDTILSLLQQAVKTRTWMLEGIIKSREKDYNNPFRKMVYDSQEEMDKVMGSFNENSFIKQEELALKDFRRRVEVLEKKVKPAKGKKVPV